VSAEQIAALKASADALLEGSSQPEEAGTGSVATELADKGT
jgi:hypothetical protein